MPAAPTPRRRTAAKPKPKALDLHALGGRVRSVFGPFNSRTLVELPTDRAMELFPDGALGAAAASRTVDAVELDLEVIRQQAPDVADSTIAASALALAYEMDDPYNSATSKSMCARVLLDTMERLRELAPPAQEADTVDDLTAARIRRLQRDAA